MQLTPEDHAKLETKQLANIIRKLNGGKTLTGREEAILARARLPAAAGVQTPAPAPLASAFAENFEELAQALGVSRKSLQNWRSRADLVGKFPTPRADGRHDVAAWSRFMVEHQLARADDHVVPGSAGYDELSGAAKAAIDWKNEREQLMCTKLQREIDREDGKLLVATDHEIAMGQLLAGLMAGLNHLPGSAARTLVGLRDIHAIQARLEDEVLNITRGLHAARYLEEDVIAEAMKALPADPETLNPALLRLIETGTREALRAIGRRALAPVAAELPAAPASSDRDPVPAAPTLPTTAAVPPAPATRPAPPPSAQAPSEKTARRARRPSGGKKKAKRASQQPAKSTRRCKP